MWKCKGTGGQRSVARLSSLPLPPGALRFIHSSHPLFVVLPQMGYLCSLHVGYLWMLSGLYSPSYWTGQFKMIFSFSPRASSPIWASETSLARTHEQKEGPSLARSREARFACPNRRVCSQATFRCTLLTNPSWSTFQQTAYKTMLVSVP